MDDIKNALLQLRTLRQIERPIYVAQAIKETLSLPPESSGIGIWICTSILVALGLLFYNHSIMYALDLGIMWGFFAAVIYWLFPIASFLFFIIRYRRFPDERFLNSFSTSQKMISCAALAFGLVVLFDIQFPHLLHWWKTDHPHFHYILKHGLFLSGHREYFDWLHFLIAWFFTTTGLIIVLGLFFFMVKPRKLSSKKIKRAKRPKISSSANFSLWLGESTGWFASMHHSAAIAAEQAITLSLEDAAQNIIVLGGIGSGKTTRIIHPLLIQLFDQDCGGLIFDIKGDFKKAVLQFAEASGKKVITIGPNQQPLDLLAGLTPEVTASFLKSSFILSNRNHLDSFWVDTATELCRNSLGVLSFFPQHYHLQGLYQYLFEPKTRDAINEQAFALIDSLNEKQKRLLESYISYYENIYLHFEDKVKSNVSATVAQTLSPFNHPDLVDAFCSSNPSSHHLRTVLTGDVFLIDIPLSIWGLGGKVAYTFIKLRFFNVMQQRLSQPEWNQDRPVFFLCDEFQEIVSANRDGLSDLNFWDKSRSSKTIGIISAQSISSFYAAIGDRDIANALMQNFRQKICFKTEDQTTLENLNRLLGHIEKPRHSQAVQQGSSSIPDRFRESKQRSSSESLTYIDKPLLDGQLLRELGQNQAVALLSLHGHSMDDVLTMMPVFV